MTLENSEGDIIDVEARLDSLDTSIADHLAQIQAIQARMDEVLEVSPGEFLALQAQATSLQSQLTALDARVAALEGP